MRPPEGGSSTKLSTFLSTAAGSVDTTPDRRLKRWTSGLRPMSDGGEAVEPEETDVVARRAVERQVGADLTDD